MAGPGQDAGKQALDYLGSSNQEIMRQICSVLAGHVWDSTNPYAAQPPRALPLLSRIIQARARITATEAGVA